MADETLVLRDDSGREHRVQLGTGGVETVDTSLSVRTAPDGSLHVINSTIRRIRRIRPNALAWAVTVDETRWVFVDGEISRSSRAAILEAAAVCSASRVAHVPDAGHRPESAGRPRPTPSARTTC